MLIALAGCPNWWRKENKSIPLKNPRQQLNYAMPTPLELEQIKWIIIHSENADEVFAKMEAQGLDPVLFGLVDKDYELLASKTLHRSASKTPKKQIHC